VRQLKENVAAPAAPELSVAELKQIDELAVDTAGANIWAGRV
jgi:hypothetical protein